MLLRSRWVWLESDPGREWDTVEQVAHDLEIALNNASDRPTYVLVGHSMGGLFTRWYQHEHPDQVVGMALVDPDETSAPVNGKQVPLYALTKEELQTNLRRLPACRNRRSPLQCMRRSISSRRRYRKNISG